MLESAENRNCVCEKEKSNIIYTDSIERPGTKYGILDGYYCTNCNSFWREP